MTEGGTNEGGNKKGMEEEVWWRERGVCCGVV